MKIAESIRVATSAPRVDFITEFLKFRNYVDLLRAGFGSLAFVEMTEFGLPACLGVGEHASSSTTYAVLAVRLAILFVGLAIQTLRNEKGKIVFFPAIFYRRSVGLFV